jgi:hypothetical protein
MPVEVYFKLRQALSNAVLGSSLAGDGLLVRLRSTSIALLAVVAAVGLGLVAFISQMGWPAVFSGPIPAGPELGVVRNDPISAPLAPARPSANTPSAAGRTVAARPGGGPDVASTVDPSSGLAPAHRTEPAPVESAPPPQATTPHPAAQPTTTPGPAAIVVTTPSGEAEPPTPQRSAAPRAPEPRDETPVKSSDRRGHGPKTTPPWWAGGEDEDGNEQHGHDWDDEDREPAPEDHDWDGDEHESGHGDDGRRG